VLTSIAEEVQEQHATDTAFVPDIACLSQIDLSHPDIPKFGANCTLRGGRS